MTTKQLIDLLLECPMSNEVQVIVDGELVEVKDCDADSVTTFITIDA